MDWKETSWALGNRGSALSLTSLDASCIFPGSRDFHTHVGLDDDTISTSYLERVKRKGTRVKCPTQRLTHNGY